MKLIQGDSLEVMSAMPAQSFEVAVTSPPYNIGLAYAGFQDHRDDYEAWTLAWLEQAVRLCRRGVLLNIDTRPSDQTALYRTLGAIASRFTIQNSIVWAKSMAQDGPVRGHVKPINGPRYLNPGHELLLHIVSAPVHVDRLAVGVPYADKYSLARFGASGRPDLRCAGSVWWVPYPTRVRGMDHPASFPVALANRAIRYAGGTGAVLDPFAGSGTTLVAAEALGRESVGIEIDPASVEIANRRIGSLAKTPATKAG